MTAKQFFKSVTFKSIITLLCILLVCGVFLTVAYGFLEVTDAERLQRAVNKIYGKEMPVTEVEYDESEAAYSTSSIIAAYLDEDGNYLIKAKGKGGFGGTVTCWVLVEIDNKAVSKVSKVVIETSDGETLLSSINFLDKYAEVTYEDGFIYSADNGFVTANATLSSNAINNSVNGAVRFVRETCLGIEYIDPYEEFLYHDYIDMDYMSELENGFYELSGTGEITYNIKTAANAPAGAFEMTITVDTDGKIKSYEITKYGSVPNNYQGVTAEQYNKKINVTLYIGWDAAKFLSVIGDGDTNANYADNGITAGATRSNYLCLYAGLFATANYEWLSTPDADTETDAETDSEITEGGEAQ